MTVPRFSFPFPYGSRPRGADSPELLPAGQPRPVETIVSRMRLSGRWVTALVRRWRPDEVKDCRLCSRGCCSARAGLCVFQVDEYIADEAAPLYRIADIQPSP